MGEEHKEKKEKKKSEKNKDENNTDNIKKEKKDKKERKEKEVNTKATPMLVDKAVKKAYDTLAQGKKNRLVKIGVNEVIKKLNKGDIEIIFIAGDVKPFAIVEPIIHLCENKNRSFYFTPSAVSLGKACGLSRPIAACAIIYSENAAIKKTTSEIRDMMSNV